jgi:hypothetical protein
LPSDQLDSASTLVADGTELLFVVQLRAMLHDETTDARELIGLRRQNNNIHFQVGKI